MKAPGTQAELRNWQCLCSISDNGNSSALGLSNGYARRAPAQSGALGWCWVHCSTPRHSRHLPSTKQGESPPRLLVHGLLLGCKGGRCSSGLGWVLALGTQEGLEGDTSPIPTRAGWLGEPGLAEPVAGLQERGDAASPVLSPGAAGLQPLPGSRQPAPSTSRSSARAPGISHN